MKDESDIEPDELAAAERRVRDEIRRLPRLEAPASFGARLRHEFTSGALAASPRTSRAGWRLRPRVAVALFVPAGVLAALVIALLNRSPGWTLDSVRGEGQVLVDGQAIPAGEADRLASRLAPGARLVLRGEVELDLLGPRNLAVQITPGTDTTVPRLPGRWFGRRVEAEVRSGEVRIVTGPRFRGAVLRVVTPEADVEVVGTTLAVIRDATATCVCAFEGSVRMGPRTLELETVPPGMRRFLYNDGRPPAMLAIDAMENMKLQMFQDNSRPKLSSAP